VQSGEIIEGTVMHLWEDKSVLMVRVTSEELVYIVPANMLLDEGKRNNISHSSDAQAQVILY